MLRRILENIALAVFALFIFVVMVPFWIIYYWLKPEAAIDRSGRGNAPRMADGNDPVRKAERLDF